MDRKIQVRHNDFAVWTKEQVIFFKNNNMAYPFSAFKANDLLSRLDNGEVIKRVSGKAQCFFEILQDGKLVGEFFMNKYDDSDDEWEFSIGIYDEFHKRGIAEQALCEFIKCVNVKKIVAVVLDENENKEIINHILEKIGFMDNKDCCTTEWEMIL